MGKPIFEPGIWIGLHVGVCAPHRAASTRPTVPSIAERYQHCLRDGLEGPRKPPDAEHSFKHAQVQQAVYGSPLNRCRPDMHRRMFRSLAIHIGQAAQLAELSCS